MIFASSQAAKTSSMVEKERAVVVMVEVQGGLRIG
jgi:hypothetical protein